MNGKRLTIFLFALLLLLMPAVALAQGDTPSGIPPAEEIIAPAAAWELLLGAILAIVAGGLGQAPITTFAVALLKRIPFLHETPGSTLQVVVGGILTAGLWIAVAAGFEAEFRSIADLIVVAGPALLNLLATFSGSSAYYNMAQRAGDPVFGYKRSPAPVYEERWDIPVDDTQDLDRVVELIRQVLDERENPGPRSTLDDRGI